MKLDNARGVANGIKEHNFNILKLCSLIRLIRVICG